MIERTRNGRIGKVFARLKGWANDQFVPALKRHRIVGAAFVASVLSIFYWGIVASDRYVSEAHIIIQRTDLVGGQVMDFSNILGTMGGGNSADQLLLRDYLLSVDMLKTLDEKLDLRRHYSTWYRDPLSRLWSKNAPLESFHEYYLSRVSAEFDTYAGVLVIKAQAYDPETAHGIAVLMVQEGERYMNAMAHRLAEEQVAFLEKQVTDLRNRAIEARKTVLDFQNKKGMVSPQSTAESLATIISKLEAQLTELQTRRSAMLGYLVPESPRITELNQQITAVQKQLAIQNARLASPNHTALNQAVEEYQRLQLNAEFTQDVYKTALVALEKGRIEATRTLKKVSVLQSPTEPQYPLEPRRLYNTVVFILVVLLIAGTAQLIAAIVRDHRD